MQEYKCKKLYNKYYLLIEIDVTIKTKHYVFKDKMQKWRNKKLCFECGLLGHMASSYWKGRAL